MDGMRGSYRNYEEARNEYNRGNYWAKEDGLKELEYMLHALVKFAKTIKEEATSERTLDGISPDVEALMLNLQRDVTNKEK